MKLEVTMKQSLSGLLGVVVLAATPLLAEERMNFAFGFQATSAVGLAVEDYIAAAAERSDGEIVITGFPMTLLSIPETNAGVRDRLADMFWRRPANQKPPLLQEVYASGLLQCCYIKLHALTTYGFAH